MIINRSVPAFLLAGLLALNPIEPGAQEDTGSKGPVVSAAPQPLRETGKIYLKDHWIYVNEQERGIHVIDNSDPANPAVRAFLEIAGNVDIAIRDEILYADSGQDLLVIDITDPQDAVEIRRIRDIFPRYEPAPPWRSGGCFPAGTGMLTPGGQRAIETLEPGSQVFACDLVSGTWGAATVSHSMQHEYCGDLIRIGFADTQVEATGDQPFYVLRGSGLSQRPQPPGIRIAVSAGTDSGRWVEARHLRIGDVLRSKRKSELAISALSSRTVQTRVFNITVAERHNYAAFASGILVHNKAQEEVEAKASDSGTGGSLARFTIVGDFLYTLSGSALQLFDIEVPADPKIWRKIEVGWDIETIFPYRDTLFIGGQEGMYIYDNSNPAKPRRLSRFRHVTSCDPVVVEGDYAYVTLRGGTRCGGGNDQLEIIDVSDLENPELVAIHPMQGPFGLGIDGPILFVCDGEAGLKIFDASDPRDLRTIGSTAAIRAIDVILTDKRAIVVAGEGLYQYDYRNPRQFRRISVLPVR